MRVRWTGRPAEFPACLPWMLSIGAPEPADGKFDRAARQFAPALDFVHVGGLRVGFQKGLGPRTEPPRAEERTSHARSHPARCVLAATCGRQVPAVEKTCRQLQQKTTWRICRIGTNPSPAALN